MKTQILILFIAVFSLSSCAQNYDSFEELKNEIISKTVPLISVQDLKKVENTKKPLLVLDAREESEYNVSHIKNAKYVGYDNFKIKT